MVILQQKPLCRYDKTHRPGELHLRCAFGDFHQSPAFGLGDRAGFLDCNGVTDVALIALVVSMNFG